tara:strand:- start:71 stop:370 length:300 start_codon:yes stop_codon:yes gene_type:complete
MSDQVKFTEDELKQLAENRQAYTNIQNALGQLSYQRMVMQKQLSILDEQEADVEKQWDEATQKEQEFVKGLNDKYGPGTLNPETGEFTPAPPAESEEAS